MPMKLEVGDRIITKKSHPCGGKHWRILRTGADFVIQCETCSHKTWIPRPKLEKAIKEVLEKEGGDK